MNTRYIKWYGIYVRLKLDGCCCAATAQRCPLLDTGSLKMYPSPPKVRKLSMACPECPRTESGVSTSEFWFAQSMARNLQNSATFGFLWTKWWGKPNNRWFKTLFSPLYKMTVNRGQLPMFQTTPKFCQATAHALSWWQAAGPGGPRTTPSTEMHCRNYEARYWIL